MRSRVAIFLLLGGIYLLLSGACGGDSVGVIPSEDRSTTAPPIIDPDSATALTFGLVTFMEYESLSYQVFKDGTASFDATAGCSIDKDTTTLNDIKCSIDVAEEDLHYHGVELEMVIPPGMCDYVSIFAPYYYNFETGYGPTSIRIEKDTNEDGLLLANRCSVNGIPGAPDANTCSGVTPGEEIRGGAINVAETAITCQYDYRESNGPNCCAGSYFLTTVTTDIVTPGAPVTSTQEYEWGGPNIECFGGAAYLNDSFRVINGTIPIKAGLIQYSLEDGFANRFQIAGAVFRSITGTNAELANWHANVEECDGVNTTSCDDRHHHQNSVGGGDSYAPVMIDPIEDRNRTPMWRTTDAWTLNCIDENREIKQRIRLYIREYDVLSDFENFIAAPVNGNQNADKRGTEGGGGADDCPGFSGGACNDMYDLDDYTMSVPGSLQTPNGYTCGTAGCYPEIFGINF